MEKKIILVKQEGRYVLYSENGVKIASSAPNPFKKLSTSNCDELFGIVDVEKLAKEYVDVDPNLEIGTSEYHNAQVDFKAGFNKKAELDKDKLFTLEDMFNLYTHIVKNGIISGEEANEFIQSLQQPTEIEVQIVMDDSFEKNGDIYIDENGKGNYHTHNKITKLDKNGCLILKKKL